MSKPLTEEEVHAVIRDLADYLAAQETPHFLPGGDATIWISTDEGKTFREIGHGCIGDIRIVRRKPPD